MIGFGATTTDMPYIPLPTAGQVPTEQELVDYVKAHPELHRFLLNHPRIQHAADTRALARPWDSGGVVSNPVGVSGLGFGHEMMNYGNALPEDLPENYDRIGVRDPGLLALRPMLSVLAHTSARNRALAGLGDPSVTTSDDACGPGSVIADDGTCYTLVSGTSTVQQGASTCPAGTYNNGSSCAVIPKPAASSNTTTYLVLAAVAAFVFLGMKR